MDPVTLQQCADAVRAGDIRTGARLITQAENGDPAIRPLLQQLYRHGGHARIIGITGPTGAGKSTLVDQMIGHYRGQGLRVAVLAVDPSSPITGGAVLGDRLRMSRHDVDSGVFIRSMATRGVLGGLAQAVGDALTVLDAMAWDILIVETVGVGQNEMDIVRHASCVVLLQTALGGDAVQAAKAGILEIGDIFVVNKADAADAGRMVNALNEMIGARPGHGDPAQWQPAVLPTIAVTGKGVDELAAQIERRFTFLAEHTEAARALRIAQLRARTAEIVKELASRRIDRLSGGDVVNEQWVADVLARRSDPYALAEYLVGNRDL